MASFPRNSFLLNPDGKTATLSFSLHQINEAALSTNKHQIVKHANRKQSSNLCLKEVKRTEMRNFFPIVKWSWMCKKYVSSYSYRFVKTADWINSKPYNALWIHDKTHPKHIVTTNRIKGISIWPLLKGKNVVYNLLYMEPTLFMSELCIYLKNLLWFTPYTVWCIGLQMINEHYRDGRDICDYWLLLTWAIVVKNSSCFTHRKDKTLITQI